MQTEYEIKFIIENKESYTKKLVSLGSSCTKPNRLMKRKVFHMQTNNQHDDKVCWARVRDEGDKITMTVKVDDKKNTVASIQETEIVVSNFDNTCTIIETLGHIPRAYQETYREEWQLDNCMITIDQWPGLPLLTEIEGPTEKDVELAIEKLCFDKKDGTCGGAGYVYEKLLNIPATTINLLPELTFETIEQTLATLKK